VAQLEQHLGLELLEKRETVPITVGATAELGAGSGGGKRSQPARHVVFR
jgi:hypothetical protein